MHYADGRYTITFNGEIYNYIELKKQLVSAGYTFRSESDTEILMAMYHQRREAMLKDLDGMFAFAIWDNQEKRLFCARDRFGEKPFFYSHTAHAFLFASEIKALLAAGINSEKNNRKIYNYLLFTSIEDSDHKSETFFRDVQQLESSHYLVVEQNGTIHKHRYWDIDLSQRTTLSESESSERFLELLKTSVERRLRSDVPVGSSLSGGLDSSSIVMLIDQLKQGGQTQKTFSARFEGYVKDEGKYMNMVIEKTNVEPHFVFPDLSGTFQKFEKILYHQEAPIGSSSILAQFEVMKLAKDNHIKVLLDGQGADEVLSGYEPYWNTYFMQLYRQDRKLLTAEEQAYSALRNLPPYVHDTPFKVKAYSPNFYTTLGNLQRKFIPANSSYFLGIHPNIAKKFKFDSNPLQKFNDLRKHLYYSTMEKGLNDLLRYSDRNAMANSVEVRLPFLYHELVEFIFSLPNEFLLQNGWTKHILRNSMKQILPAEITWRKDKIGYEPPQQEWMESALYKDYLQTAIDFLKKEGIIARENSSLHWNYISLYAFYKAFN